MGKKTQVQQEEAKKGIGRDKCLMEIVDTVSIIAENYYGVDKICPVEITFSQDIDHYITNFGTNDLYYNKVNEKGIMLATCTGGKKHLRGCIYIQYFKDIFLPCISKILDDVEYRAAKKMLQIDAIDKKYLWEARNILKLAVPDADLVLWTSDITALHITDLNQDHEFKRKLKKTGLI